ncbi:MAG TPA: methyltransferase domain-containing protein [Gemmatimonadales bacterium]|nr:methyltransferase domain-containing protein [Gemmatimonadales bacterium]
MPATLVPSAIGHEILDDPAADPRHVRRMLGDIARSNRWFGGIRSLHRGLRRLLPFGGGGTVTTLLDVGTGAGDLPRAAVRWGARHRHPVRALGLERHDAAARLATELGTPTLVGCGGTLPLADRTVDLVLLSQLLHHLDDASAIRLLTEADRVARLGVIVLDLQPSRLAAGAFRLVGPVLRFDPATTSDGLVSLARGRTAPALVALANAAGVVSPHAEQLMMARVVMTWRVTR